MQAGCSSTCSGRFWGRTMGTGVGVVPFPGNGGSIVETRSMIQGCENLGVVSNGKSLLQRNDEFPVLGLGSVLVDIKVAIQMIVIPRIVN